MRFVSETRAYKKDLQREERGQYRFVIRDDLPTIIEMLAADIVLPPKYRDHELIGDWISHRECHVKPDLLLIYMKIDDKNSEDKSGELRLVRLGSHSELF